MPQTVDATRSYPPRNRSGNFRASPYVARASRGRQRQSMSWQSMSRQVLAAVSAKKNEPPNTQKTQMKPGSTISPSLSSGAHWLFPISSKQDLSRRPTRTRTPTNFASVVSPRLNKAVSSSVSVPKVPQSSQAFVASAERRELAASAGRGRTITRGTRCAFCAKRHSLPFCAFSAISASSALLIPRITATHDEFPPGW